MRTLSLVVAGVILLATFFQCFPSTSVPEPTEPSMTDTISAPTPTDALAPSTEPATPEPIDLSHIVITSDDLPSGFHVIPNEEWWGEEEVAESQRNGDSLFALQEPEQLQFVFGRTILLGTSAEVGAFDAILHRPTMLMEAAVGPPGEVDILEQGELEMPTDIGDVCAAITLAMDMGADRPTARLDVLGFRRSVFGVTVFVMYPDGDSPLVSVQDVGHMLDDRAESGGQQPRAVARPSPPASASIPDGYQFVDDEGVRLAFAHPSGWVEDRGGFEVPDSTATVSFVSYTIQSELGSEYKLIQFMRIDQAPGHTPETLIEQVLGINEQRLEQVNAELLDRLQDIDVDGEPASGIVYRATDPRGVRFFAILLAVNLPDSGYIFQWASSIEHEQEMREIYEVMLPTIEFTE